jgi:hypothetical protein
VAHHQEQRREAFHFLFEQRLDRFGRDVAAGEAGATGADDHVDIRRVDPCLHTGADHGDVVGYDRAVVDRMTGRLDAVGERCARLVVGHLARVGHGEHRDFQRDEFSVLVNAGHGDLQCNHRSKEDDGRMPPMRAGHPS